MYLCVPTIDIHIDIHHLQYLHVLSMHDRTNRNHHCLDDASQDTHEPLLDWGLSGMMCSCQILGYIPDTLSLCTTVAADHQTVYGNVALFVPSKINRSVQCHTPVLKITEPKPLYVCPGCLITRIATI
jgi:hypothetical protein